MIRKLLIFDRGRIGDPIIALPELLAIRKQYLKRKGLILTSTPSMESASPSSLLFAKSDLIYHYFIFFPGGGLGELPKIRI